MVRYHGGKQLVGKEFSEIIYMISIIWEKKTKRKLVGYCEPFCGMCGIYKHIPEKFTNVNFKFFAGDKHKSLIMMWMELQNGWIPPKIINKKKFNTLKHSNIESSERAFIGFGSSFGGQYFQGYAYKESPKNITNIGEKLIEQSQKLKQVVFICGEYEIFSHIKNFIIYCDPPYNCNTTRYSKKGYHEEFNHDEFYKWCNFMSRNNLVLISEYSSPKGINSIKIFESKKSNTINGKLMPSEKLYMII